MPLPPFHLFLYLFLFSFAVSTVDRKDVSLLLFFRFFRVIVFLLLLLLLLLLPSTSSLLSYVMFSFSDSTVTATALPSGRSPQGEVGLWA